MNAISHDEKRERIIRHILDRKIAGMGVGIFGAEVCQLCGGIGRFSGLLHAWAVHVRITGERSSLFVCGKCWKQSSSGDVPQENVWSTEQRSRVVETLEAQPHRYCEICQTQVERSDINRYPHEHGWIWCCPACQEVLERDGYERHSTRRRYLELMLTDDQQLRAFDIALAAERL